VTDSQPASHVAVASTALTCRKISAEQVSKAQSLFHFLHKRKDLHHCTATRTSSYSPVGPRVFLYIFSLGLCFACLFVVFRLDVIATATWLGGWLAGWLGVRHTPVLYQNG